MKQLELKHISPYLPYELKVNNSHGVPVRIRGLIDLKYIEYFCDKTNFASQDLISETKPLLRPVSDLFENIVHNEEIVCVAKVIKNLDNSIEWWNDERTALHYPEIGEFCITSSDPLNYEFLDYSIVETLFKYHFDVFGLIEKGLAEPIKTNNNEPSV